MFYWFSFKAQVFGFIYFFLSFFTFLLTSALIFTNPYLCFTKAYFVFLSLLLKLDTYSVHTHSFLFNNINI